MDDSLQRMMKLQLLPVFSPITDTSVPLNGYLTAVSNSSDKVMLSPMLEDCRHGEPNCPPTTVDDGFLRNAEVNLEKGRSQVRDLKAERLPKSLEPIRRFLLDNLTTALRMEEARRDYIKTGAVSPLSAMLDQYCTTGRQGLVRKLEDAPDAEKRRELSMADWHNAVWALLPGAERHVSSGGVEAVRAGISRARDRETVGVTGPGRVTPGDEHRATEARICHLLVVLDGRLRGCGFLAPHDRDCGIRVQMAQSPGRPLEAHLEGLLPCRAAPAPRGALPFGCGP